MTNTSKIEAENKALTSKVKRLNAKLGETYKTINALLSDIKTQREESDAEINRLMRIISAVE